MGIENLGLRKSRYLFKNFGGHNFCGEERVKKILSKIILSYIKKLGFSKQIFIRLKKLK